MRTNDQTKGTDLDTAMQRVFKNVPKTKAMWDAAEQKRLIGSLLESTRSAAGLTQSEVAEKAGWDNTFVSRIEGIRGPIPDTVTIARFVHACGGQVSLVVTMADSDQEGEVVDAVTLDYTKMNLRKPTRRAARRRDKETHEAVAFEEAKAHLNEEELQKRLRDVKLDGIEVVEDEVGV